jgi:ABC-2 type transport system permease protein
MTENRLKRIKALVVQEYFLTKHSLELLFDIVFFPLMNVVLFGLITRFVGEIRDAATAEYLLVGVLLWEIVNINQYNVTVSSLWSVWSHNLTNIFIAPISIVEYLVSHVVAAIVRTVLVFGVLSLGAWLFFDFNILHVGVMNLTLFFVNLSLFAWALGIALLGLIFRYGTRIQAIAWGTIFLFQPLTATFFPVSILPDALKIIAYSLPPTYVFEAARAALQNRSVDWSYFFIGLAMNVVYAVIAWAVFKFLFARSKDTGQFARNDL